jgi:cytochrome c oxidase subunit 2
VGQVAEEVTTEEDPAAAAAAGAELFASAGCTGCHTLADAGSTGTTGPDLDGALKGKDAAYIETAIVDPNDEIAENYPPDVMPQTYGDEFSPEEIDALVAYLIEATQGGSG